MKTTRPMLYVLHRPNETEGILRVYDTKERAQEDCLLLNLIPSENACAAEIAEVPYFTYKED